MRVGSHSVFGCTAGLIAALGLLVGPAHAQSQSDPSGALGTLLPTGQRITPAGTRLPVGSMPLAAELSPDGRHLLVLQAGYETPAVTVIDTVRREATSSVELRDAWLGLTFNRTGDKLFVSGGKRRSVWELSFQDGRLAIAREFPIPVDCAPECPSLIGDVRLDADDRILYALDLLRDRVAVINTQSGLVVDEFRTGAAPYRARLGPDGRHLIVSHWGEASLGVYHLPGGQLVERVPVGEHPADLVIVPGEVQAPETGSDPDPERTYPARLFAACSHADNLWTFGISDGNRIELLDVTSVAPLPESALGSLPSALGLSRDQRTLYVANAGNNTILVADIEEALPEPSGAIPTGWFPTAVVGLGDGGVAYASGKGDLQSAGTVSLLPALTSGQVEFLSAAAAGNLAGPVPPSAPPPAGVEHATLVLTDARGSSWRRLLADGTALPGYVSPARAEIGNLAWLTGGMETDFFAKLGPALEAGRLSSQDLAAGGRAARPAAGTLWSNAADASVPAEVFGIGGGPPVDALVSKLQAGEQLARLSVVRLTGTPFAQDRVLGALLDGLADHPARPASVLFAVPVRGAEGAAAFGGPVAASGVLEGFVSAPSVLRTIGWLLGLQPMTQFGQAAPVLATAFSREQ